MGMPPAANLEQTDWRWYADDASGDPSVALAGENVKPTLAGDANYTVIRLRAVIQENGGAADAGSFDIQWTEDGGTTWNTLGAGSVGDEHLYYGDGGGVNNTTIAANLISTGGALGKYHEATGNTETIGASTDHEVDVAIYTRVFLPDTDYQFRLVINGTAVPVKSGSSAIQLRGSTAASREVDGTKNTVADLTTEKDNDINTMAWGHGNRGFFDGTRHWVFWNSAANTIAYKYTSDLDTAYNATPATVSFTAGPNAPEDFNVDFVNISGTLYVILVVRDGATSVRFKRGTISGTTITWDSTERTLTTTDDAMDGPPGLCIDPGGQWWIGGKGATASNEIWAVQSTNTLDNATYYTFNSALTASESGIEGTAVFEGVELRPLATDEVLIVYYDAGNSNLRARKCTASGGMGSPVTLNASTNSHAVDWNVSRSDGTYIYVVHGDATTSSYSWGLRVYTISSDTWAAGTSPSVTKSGSDATANDGLIVHVGDDGNIYAAGSFAPSNRDTRIKYKKYTGGTSGTWDGSLTDLTQPTTTFIGNADGMGYSLDSANFVVFNERGDTTETGTYRILEFYHTASASAAVSLSGTGDAAADGSGDIDVTRGISGSGPAASEGSGALGVTRPLSGTGDAASDGSGDITVYKHLSGSGPAASEGSGALEVKKILSGSGPAASEGSGAVDLTRGLSGSGDAASEGNADLSLSPLVLSGAGEAASEGSGDLDLTRGLSGSGPAASEGSGALGVTRPMSGTGDAASDGSGDLTVSSNVNLSGSGPAASSGSGDMTVTRGLSGTGDAASDGTASLDVTYDLSGAGPAASEGSGVLSPIRGISGAGPAASEGTGTLSPTRGLSGAGDVASDGSGDLTVIAGTVNLSGTGDAAADGSGDLTVIKHLTGTGDVASDGNGALNLMIDLSGAGEAASDGSGVLSLQAQPVFRVVHGDVRGGGVGRSSRIGKVVGPSKVRTP